MSQPDTQHPATALRAACALVKLVRSRDAEMLAVALGEVAYDPAHAASLIVALINIIGRLSDEYDVPIDDWLAEAIPMFAAQEAEPYDGPEYPSGS